MAMIGKRFSLNSLPAVKLVVCFTAVLVAPMALSADSNSFAARSERAFRDAERLSEIRPVAVSALVQLARFAFDAAEFTDGDDQREKFATRGIVAARSAIEREPTNASAHYWLGMDLGQLARTKTLGALKLVREMEKEFHRARELDAHCDYAGPDRSLGYLYRDAPGWPTSIGNRKKAREHLEQAVKLHPEFPDNQIGLVEAFDEWGDRQNFEKQLRIAEQVMADAQKKFIGPDWDTSWADWKKRMAKLQRKSGSVGTVTTGKAAK